MNFRTSLPAKTGLAALVLVTSSAFAQKQLKVASPPQVSASAALTAAPLAAMPTAEVPAPPCLLNSEETSLQFDAGGGVRDLKFGTPGQRCLQAAGAEEPWVDVLLSRQAGIVGVSVDPNPYLTARKTKLHVVHNQGSTTLWVLQAAAKPTAPLAPLADSETPQTGASPSTPEAAPTKEPATE